MFKPGKAFTDNVFFGKKRKLFPDKKFWVGWGARITLLYSCLLIFSFILCVRLFHLSIIHGSENRQLSEGNRIRTAVVHAPRGIFYDRSGIPLVMNISGFRISNVCPTNDSCPIKFISSGEWKQLGNQKYSQFYEQDYLREYINPYETAQVLGYLSEISGEEIDNNYYIYQDYLLGDKIGRMGLESVFEKELRGVNGKELVEVDAQNNPKRVLGKVDPTSGKDIYLSLDIGLQKVAYEAMGENPGAVIVSRPRTGEILALVSTPSYNPNQIHHGIKAKDFNRLINDPEHPLFNRAVSGIYPPGSTFKIITATAGLETGKITPQTQFEDVGIVKIGEFSFANWYFTQYGGTDGWVDITKAIARSNDIYFYKAGETIGITELAKWGQKFGIGAKTGIELNGEAEGLMPDPVWRKNVKDQDWYLGDSYHVAIGQGDLSTTPLQVNTWTNVIAGGGIWCRPTLLSSKVQVQSASWQTKSECKDLGIKKETVDIITEGMRRACSSTKNSPYQGTGWPMFDFSIDKESFDNGVGKLTKKIIPVACKTGSAEFGDPDNRTHAWFTAFAPVPVSNPGQYNLAANTILGDPEITVTVLVEKGGEGSSVAAPIAKKIFEEWFRR